MTIEEQPMTETPPPLAYAVPSGAADQLWRAQRAFAWFAIGYGAASAMASVSLMFALRSVSLPPRQLWPQFAPTFAAGLAIVPLAIGGARMLKRHDDGAIWIRLASAAFLLLGVAAMAWRYAEIFQASAGTATLASPQLIGSLLFEVLSELVSVPAVLFFLSFPLRRFASG